MTTALVTGAPVPTTRGWDEHAATFAARLNEQWFRPSSGNFTALAPCGPAHDTLYNVDMLLSGDGPFYAELITITHGDTTHSHACVWDEKPDQETFAFSSMTSPFFVHATTRERDTYNTSSWNRTHATTPQMLDSFIFEDQPAHPNLPPIDPAMFLRTCTVEHQSGTELGDPAWRHPIPESGTDIVFDQAFPNGIWGHYDLRRKQNLEK